MLIFWTGANPSEVLSIVKPVLKRLQYKGDFQVEKISLDGEIYRPPSPDDVVIAMGTKALNRLQSKGYIPKNRTVNSMRGNTIPCSDGGCWMVTNDPALTQMQADAEQAIIWDVTLAVRYHDTGSLLPIVGDYSWVEDFDAVIEYIEWNWETTGKALDVALDLETMGLYPWYPDKDIVSVSLTVEEGVADVFYSYGKPKDKLDNLIKQLEYILTTKKVKIKGANLKFDLLWIKVKWAIKCLNFTMDTLIVGSLIDENRSNSLGNHAKQYTSMGGYDDDFNSAYDKGAMEKVPLGPLLTYAGGDTDATLRVSNVLRKEIGAGSSTQRLYTRLLHRAVRAFERVEENGVLVDPKEFKKLRVEVLNYIDEHEEAMLDLLPKRLLNKYSEAIHTKKKQGKSPFTPAILKAYFFSPLGLNLKPKKVTEKTSEPSTAHEHLIMFNDDPDAKAFVSHLECVTGGRKTLSTYIDGFLKHLRPDGKFHPTYALYAGSMFEGKDDNAGTNCYVADTSILTSRGYILHKDIRVGDLVVGHDGDFHPVIDKGDNGKKDVYEIKTKSGHRLVVTANHPIRVGESWVEASNLCVGDSVKVYGEGEKWVRKEVTPKRVLFQEDTVVSVERRPPENTYFIEVDGAHSHITNGIVSHNTGRTSAKNPAIQCLEGSMRVLTNTGWRAISTLVDGYEKGDSVSVITHTGKEKEVVGVYRNGVKPVLTLSFTKGKVVTSTGNHPYLTSRGWVRADELKTGDTCYALKGEWFRPSNSELYQPYVQQLGRNEKSVSMPNQQRLQELRRSGYTAMYSLAPVPELFRGHGGEAGGSLVNRSKRCEWALHSGELSVGECKDPNAEPEKQQAYNLPRENSDRRGVGLGVRDKSGKTTLSVDRFGTAYGDSLDEGEVFEPRLFEECKVESITLDGECETFDITVKDSHSFIAEGVVVHNTLPKHTVWAKKLRKAYVAPKGKVVFQTDFSQGELRVTACVANELKMLEAYRKGMDLHAVTGSKLAGLEYGEFIKKATTDPEFFGMYRQRAKPANFGLLYGMGWEGYREYARISYGVILTPEEAQQQRDAFFELYHGLVLWHDEYKKKAADNKYVVSPLGRVRHLPLINSKNSAVRSRSQRQAINSPIQSCLSDMCLWSIAILDEKYGKDAPELEICGMTHDSIYGYVPEDTAVEWVTRVVDVMQTLPFEDTFGWVPQLQFPADAELGDSLATLQSVDLSA